MKKTKFVIFFVIGISIIYWFKKPKEGPPTTDVAPSTIQNPKVKVTPFNFRTLANKSNASNQNEPNKQIDSRGGLLLSEKSIQNLKPINARFNHFKHNRPIKLLENYFSQSAFAFNHREKNYLVADSLYSTSIQQYDHSFGEQITQTRSHIFFHSESGQYGTPVLLNKSTKRLAVITRRIHLLTKNKTYLSPYTNIIGSEIDQSMGHLGRFTIFIAPEADIFPIVATLEADPNIEVELEIIEGQHYEK